MKNIYVGNLPWNVPPAEAQKDLAELFGQYDEVTRCSVIADVMDPEKNRGYAFIAVRDEDYDVMMAKLQGTPFMGRPLALAEAQPPRWAKVNTDPRRV